MKWASSLLDTGLLYLQSKAPFYKYILKGTKSPTAHQFEDIFRTWVDAQFVDAGDAARRDLFHEVVFEGLPEDPREWLLDTDLSPEEKEEFLSLAAFDNCEAEL